jgi:Cft2 family RNA processing exonuclease
MQAKKFHEEFKVGPLTLKLYPSGHVDGAAMVLIEGSHRVLYTGDWSAFETLSGSPVEWPVDVDVVVLECSVAHLRHLDDYDVRDTAAVLHAPSPVLVVATGLGEAQAAYQLLKQAGDVVIHENLQPFIRDAEALSDDAFGRALEAGMNGIVGGKELIVDSSSYKAVGRIFDRRDHQLVFLNGLPERCLAAQVVRSGDRAKVRGLGRRRCKVSQLPLPFHASRPAILEAVQNLRPKTVVLTHNDPGVLHAVARHLVKAMPELEVVVPDDVPIVFGLG